jgi:hypothetical protein
LLKFGANIEAVDDLGRRPIECIPDAADFELVPDAQVKPVVVFAMKHLNFFSQFMLLLMLLTLMIF